MKIGGPIRFWQQKKRFERLLSFSVSIMNFIVSNTLSHTFKRQGRNNRPGLLIEGDQKSEIMQHFLGRLCDKIGILCSKLLMSLKM